MPLPFSVSRAAIEPTIVTSRPSRIQTVPSPMTTSQWKRDHGSRSSRAGMFVSIVFNSGPLMAPLYPAQRTETRARLTRERFNAESRALTSTRYEPAGSPRNRSVRVAARRNRTVLSRTT